MNKKIKILLVDDDIALRKLYAEIFHNANFEVIEAEDGIEGLDKASREAPDVIFTGIVMPRMDGFTLMESLGKIAETANIPVVISSHMGREEDQKRAKELGAKDFIIRDVTRPIEVVERVSSLFAEAGEKYKLEFNANTLDAQKLVKDLNFQQEFLCLDCGEKLVLDLKLINGAERLFEGRFACPKCGWIAK